MSESEHIIGSDRLAPVLEALRGHTGDDFTRFRDEVLIACVRNRMSASGVASLDEYVALATDDTEELDQLFQELSRGASIFFRDPESFAYLATHVVPRLVDAARDARRAVRVWVPGCASGEEAYSIAMLFLEHAEESADPVQIRVLGTDIDEEGLKAARAGLYPPTIEEDVSADRLARFFQAEGDAYRIGVRLRETCSFARHNLHDAPPAVELDLVSCRYVFPYFEEKLRRRALSGFHGALRPGGCLFLGPAENLARGANLYECVDEDHAVYRAVPAGASQAAEEAPVLATGENTGETATDSRDPEKERSLAEKLEQINAELDRVNRDLRFRLSQVETMFDLVPVGLVLYEHREEGRATINRAGSAILGLSDHASRSFDRDAPRPYHLRRGRRELQRLEYPLWRALATGEPVENQTLCAVRGDGTERDILVSAAPLMDDDGTVRGAVSAFTDITEQVDEKRELAAGASAQTAINRLSLHALSESDVAPVMERAVQTVVEALNVEVAEVFRSLPGEDELLLEAGIGWPDEHIGKARVPGGSLSQAGYTLSVGAPVVVEDLGAESRFSTPELVPDVATTSGVTVIIRGAGGAYGVLGAHSAKPRSFARREIDCLQTVANLLGAALQRARIEKQLAESHERLAIGEARKAAERAEQLASLGTLAAGIAHEINNPLNSILVNAELALLRQDTGENGDKMRETLETITGEVRRCADITRRVLLLAKESDTPKSPHDINEIVKKAVELVRSHLQMEDAVVKLDLGEVPTLLLDAVSMESALVNLLRNSAEAGPPGVTIEARTWEESEHVHLTIADDGPGMEPEVLDRLFTPFFSTKRGSKGTGLGLALVHRTISTHDGDIDVHSRPGEGTVFEIRIPKRSTEADTAADD